MPDGISRRARSAGRRPWPWLCLLAVLLLPTTAALADDSANQQPPETAPTTAPLTMAQAVAMATAASDPEAVRFAARARALDNQAVADAQLPDPMITAQVAGVPTDSFSLDRDGMTQPLRLGLRQEFPAGRTLAVRGRQRRAEAQAQRARSDEAVRRIALDTRQAWLELAWQQRAVGILEESRTRIKQQIESLQSRFATGRLNAQSLLRSELELSLLDDRIAEHRRMADQARAALTRYIGSEAFRRLPESLPEFALDSTKLRVLEQRLVDHPAVRARQAMIEAADEGIELARQAYKPKWAIEAGYGLRLEDPDLASIGVSLSVPLFTDKRQDKQHQAAIQRSRAAQFERDTVLRNLREQLDQALADWRRYRERQTLYEQVVGQRAEETVEASVTTYANGQTDFAELIRSQLAALDTQIKQVELTALAGKAWARVTYLVGESS